LVAAATLTLMAWTNAHCPPPCGRVVMSIPGRVLLEAKRLTAHRHRSGRGRVLTCPSCRELVEVVEHVRDRS
jgi:hypothetical protein